MVFQPAQAAATCMPGGIPRQSEGLCVSAQARLPGISSALAYVLFVFLLWKNQELPKGAENDSLS